MTPTKATEFRERVSTLADEARGLKVDSQEAYELAAEKLRGVRALKDEIIEHHREMKQRAYQAHQAVIAAEKKLLDPVAEAEYVYKRLIGAYETEQRRIEAEAQAQRDREAQALAEAEREREIEAAEAAGADAHEVAALIAEPLPVVYQEPPQPTFQRARGISTAAIWKGEVVSLQQLVRAIAKGEANVNLVAADQPAINALARATRGTLAVPGIRFFNESSVRTRR